MAETFSPVRPRARWGIPSLVSAIKTCGLAVPKTAAAVADFTNERLLIRTSIWFAAPWLVSSCGMRGNIGTQFVRRILSPLSVSFTGGLNVVVARQVIVDGRKILFALSFPDCEPIDFLCHIRERHRHTGFVSAHRGKVQVLLQPT